MNIGASGSSSVTRWTLLVESAQRHPQGRGFFFFASSARARLFSASFDIAPAIVRISTDGRADPRRERDSERERERAKERRAKRKKNERQGRSEKKKQEERESDRRRVRGSGGEAADVSCAERRYRRHAGMDHNVRQPLEHKKAGLMRRHDTCGWDDTLTASSLQCNMLVCVCVAIV